MYKKDYSQISQQAMSKMIKVEVKFHKCGNTKVWPPSILCMIKAKLSNSTGCFLYNVRHQFMARRGGRIENFFKQNVHLSTRTLECMHKMTSNYFN